jgi:hypothetical protein
VAYEDVGKVHGGHRRKHVRRRVVLRAEEDARRPIIGGRAPRLGRGARPKGFGQKWRLNPHDVGSSQLDQFQLKGKWDLKGT